MTNTRYTICGAWRIVWAARWGMAAFAYLCAVTPTGINWDWFVVGS